MSKKLFHQEIFDFFAKTFLTRLDKPINVQTKHLNDAILKKHTQKGENATLPLSNPPGKPPRQLLAQKAKRLARDISVRAGFRPFTPKTFFPEKNRR